jgi:hypothetical protein
VWATAGQRFDPGDVKFDNEPFLNWVVNVSAAPPPIPSVFSISYQVLPNSISYRYRPSFLFLF